MEDKLLNSLLNSFENQTGISRNRLKDVMDRVSYHETGGSLSPETIQKTSSGGQGVGRGKYQFEMGKNWSSWGALNRLINYYEMLDEEVPLEIRSIHNKYKAKQDIDASTLPESIQDMLFIGNMMATVNGKKDLINTINSPNQKDYEDNLLDLWLKRHWRGKDKDKEARSKSFKAHMKDYNKDERFIDNRIEFAPEIAPPVSPDLEGAPEQFHVPYEDSYNQVESLPNNHYFNSVLLDDIQRMQAGTFNPLYEVSGGRAGNNTGSLNTFNVGGTHETNPLGGIPVGVGSNGKVNKVEQGESSYKFSDGIDYIFSNRLGTDGSRAIPREKDMDKYNSPQGDPKFNFKDRDSMNYYNNAYAMGGLLIYINKRKS